MASNGPADPTLWLTRKAGPAESYFFGKLDNPYSSNIVLNTCIKAEHLDPATVEAAYRALIYNQPMFRADVKKGEDGNYFTPATDYSGVFQFVDQSEAKGGVTGYTGCWDLAEELANQPIPVSSGAPLHKCYLVKRPDCYILINQYHHGIGDGRTGFRVVNEILRQYERISSGGGADLKPAPLLPHCNEMAAFAQNDEAVERMIEDREERAKLQQILLPVDKEEVAASRASSPWKNKSFSAVGTPEGFQKMRALCQKLGITVGSYSFAVLFFAVAAVHIRRQGGKFPKEGLPKLYTDAVADLRKHLEPNPGECFMLCISLAWINAEVHQNTSLLDIARSISEQLKTCYQEQRIPLFQADYHAKLATKPQAQLLYTLPEGTYCEFSPSNQLVFDYPTKYSWGEVTSVHSLGSYWCPLHFNQIVMYQCVNGVMNYSVSCCDGQNNTKDAREVFDLFVEFMECTEKVDQSTTCMDFVNQKPSGD